MPNVHQISA
jgi:hypothetical protein